MLANGSIVESTNYRFVGELSEKLISAPLASRISEVTNFLSKLETETEISILIVDACKWSIDQTLEMGLLFFTMTGCCSSPPFSERPLITLNLSRLTRLDDSQTPRSTLVLREQNDDYTFLVSDESLLNDFTAEAIAQPKD